MQAGDKLDVDDVRKNEHILWDFTNFNDIPNSILTIFQVLTLEHWIDPVMYQYMSANNKYLTSLYFLGLVIIGYFFMMNLFLAQMIESFNKQSDESETDSQSSMESSPAITRDGSKSFVEAKLGHMVSD